MRFVWECAPKVRRELISPPAKPELQVVQAGSQQNLRRIAEIAP